MPARHDAHPERDSAHGENHDHRGNSHGLTRAGETQGVSDARLLWAVVLNQLLTVGQVVAGVVSGSVALLSDAAHNFNDANALLIAYIARRISRKQASEFYTFGYRRAELIGAVINLTLLGAIGLVPDLRGHQPVPPAGGNHRLVDGCGGGAGADRGRGHGVVALGDEPWLAQRKGGVRP